MEHVHPLFGPDKDKVRCLYVPGSTSVVDLIVDGRLYYSNQSLANNHLTYCPDAVIIPYAEAEALIEAAIDAKYDAISPEVVTREHWYTQLNLLPPLHYRSDEYSTSFKCAEFLESDWTMGFVRYLDQYVKFPVQRSTVHAWMRAHAERFLRDKTGG